MTEEEARVVYEMTLRNELSGGTPVVREFEAEWRQFTGLDYAITTGNGTSALYSAYFGLGMGPPTKDAVATQGTRKETSRSPKPCISGSCSSPF